MGFAKYHEDDLHIFEERMYYKNKLDTLSVVRNTYRTQQPTYSVFCPFCRCGLSSSKALIDHIFNVHGRKYEFVYLNNASIKEYQCDVTRIYSLKLYCFYDHAKQIVITDDFDRKYYIDTSKGKYEYDVTNALKGKLFSYLRIEIPEQDTPYEIQQYLDMDGISIDSILQNRHVSSLFDIRISNNLLDVNESLVYMKMLIHEGEDTEPFIQRIESCHFDKSRELTELYWYFCLNKKTFDVNFIDEKIGRYSLWCTLEKILNGDYQIASELLKKESRNDMDAIGLRLINAILTGDEMTLAYNKNKYTPYGIIGMLANVLLAIRNYEKDIRVDTSLEMKEVSLFSTYPLVKALLNYGGAEQGTEALNKESYDLLKCTGGIISILYCENIESGEVVEKIIKSNVKLHPDSQLLKNIALDKAFSWIGRRISVSDGEVYRRKLEEENEKKKYGFTEQYFDTFPFDNEITVTALGGERGIGASCFVISYKGYNIMIDVGLNPKKRDSESYPLLDTWDGNIDLILLSHAHIDHSGGIPKAHAMWNNARILMTKPTKVLLKYIYSDMAKVKNGIADDFEIENVNITKDVMESTLNAISTIDFEDKIRVGDEIEICFHKAGHIVGAAMIELRIAGKTILYTGDYTDYDQNFVSGLNYEDIPQNVDYLITESTYLARGTFDRYQQAEKLKTEIRECISAGKSILLSGASIGRSQELICILGEMFDDNEIPENYSMFIAGMAIPTTTQLIPFFNEEYEKLLARFEEFDGINYPEERSIVVASSGNMKRGSASYKIEKFWRNYNIRHKTILGGLADEDTEYEGEEWRCSDRCRMPLSTHVNRDGIKRVIEYTQPKVISMVHYGSDFESAKKQFKNECIDDFKKDIYFLDMVCNKRKTVFNLLEHLMEEG